MDDQSPELNAAIRAIRGESDLNAVVRALGDRDMARVIALAPGAHPIVRAVAALSGGLPDLLDVRIIADPALHDAVAHLIGTTVGERILASWTNVAPADWGRTHAAPIIDAVQQNTCRPWAAAALIGPCDESAALLHAVRDIAFAIRCWGASTPDTPIAWMEALSVRERDRLIRTVRSDPFDAGVCLPWLPPDAVQQMSIGSETRHSALNAFAEASPKTRALHAAFLQRLVAQTNPEHLGALTRLACAMQSENVWQRVLTLVRESPAEAERVVVAASWNALPDMVRTIVADASPVIGAARGRRAVSTLNASENNVDAFFAALDPNVWNALNADEQRPWLRVMTDITAGYAVQSLGPRPEFLRQNFPSWTIDILVRAARRHAHDADSVRAVLFPVALRNLPPDAAHALIAALPTLPSDLSAFFVIASGTGDPSVIALAQETRHTPADLACAVALQRSVERHASIRARCAALNNALRDRPWENLESMAPMLSNAARSACLPQPAALARQLAPPERQDALRQTLTRLRRLPPEIAVPTYVALRTLKDRRQGDEAATEIAALLRMHGDLFLSVADALANHLNAALPPSLPDPRRNAALRDLARDDPPTAQRLAQVVQNPSWNEVFALLQEIPPLRRRDLAPDASLLVERLARPEQRTPLQAALARLEELPPEDDAIVRFALDALSAWSANRRRGAAEALAGALHAHGDMFVAITDALPPGLSAALLPLPKREPLADALRALARDDPPTAHRLAHALHESKQRDVILALFAASPQHATMIWRALNPSIHTFISTMLANATLDAGRIANILSEIARHDPLAPFALAAATQSVDDDLHVAGMVALSKRPNVLRVVWDRLPQEAQQSLQQHPSIAVAVADISAEARDLPMHRRRIR